MIRLPKIIDKEMELLQNKNKNWKERNLHDRVDLLINHFI